MVAILPCEEPCLDCAGLAEHEDPGFGRYTPARGALRAKTGGKGITLPLVHPKVRPGYWILPPRLAALEVRGFEPLTFSLRTRRSTN